MDFVSNIYYDNIIHSAITVFN